MREEGREVREVKKGGRSEGGKKGGEGEEEKAMDV